MLSVVWAGWLWQASGSHFAHACGHVPHAFRQNPGTRSWGKSHDTAALFLLKCHGSPHVLPVPVRLHGAIVWEQARHDPHTLLSHRSSHLKHFCWTCVPPMATATTSGDPSCMWCFHGDEGTQHIQGGHAAAVFVLRCMRLRQKLLLCMRANTWAHAAFTVAHPAATPPPLPAPTS